MSFFSSVSVYLFPQKDQTDYIGETKLSINKVWKIKFECFQEFLRLKYL